MKSLLFAAVALAAAPLGARPADQGSILAAADEFDRIQLAQDEMAMERMILDSFVFIDGSGERHGKHAFIAGWLTPGDKYDPITLRDRVFTPLGDNAAAVSAETSLCGTSDGVRFCRRMRFTDTFVRVGGAWRVAHVQVTRMKD